MAAILIGGRGRRIQSWKGTTQGPFHQSLVQIGQAVSEKKIFNDFFAEFSIFSHGGHLGWWAGSSDTILKGDHQRTIPAKFGPNWPRFQRRRLKCEKLTTDDGRTARRRTSWWQKLTWSFRWAQKVCQNQAKHKKLQFWMLVLFYPLYLRNGKSYVKSVDILLKDILIRHVKKKRIKFRQKWTLYTQKYENTNFSSFGLLVSKQTRLDPPFSIPGFML